MKYIGDVRPGQTVRIPFNTIHPDTGAPINLVGGAAQVIRNGNTANAFAVTLATNVGGVTGSHLASIDTSNAGNFPDLADFQVRLTAGTVNGISVAGAWLGTFTINELYHRNQNVPANVVSWDGAEITEGLQTAADVVVALYAEAADTPLPANTVEWGDEAVGPMPGAGGGGDAPSVADIVAGIRSSASADPLPVDVQEWNGVEVTEGLQTADDVVNALYTEAEETPLQVDVRGWNGAAVDPLESADEIADVILSTPNSDYVEAGTIGANIAAGAAGGGSGGNTAAEIRAALGMANANLDAQLGTLATTSGMNARTLPAGNYATASSITALGEAVADLNDMDATDVGNATLAALASYQAATAPAVADISSALTPIGGTVAKLESMIGQSSGHYRFLGSALELAPTGSGGGGGITLEQLEARTLPTADYARQATLASAAAVNVKLDTMLTQSGSVYKFTVSALENAPAGGGGGGHLPADDIAAIREGLAMESTLATVKEKTDALQFDSGSSGTLVRSSIKQIGTTVLKQNGTGGQRYGG